MSINFRQVYQVFILNEKKPTQNTNELQELKGHIVLNQNYS